MGPTQAAVGDKVVYDAIKRSATEYFSKASETAAGLKDGHGDAVFGCGDTDWTESFDYAPMAVLVQVPAPSQSVPAPSQPQTQPTPTVINDSTSSVARSSQLVIILIACAGGLVAACLALAACCCRKRVCRWKRKRRRIDKSHGGLAAVRVAPEPDLTPKALFGEPVSRKERKSRHAPGPTHSRSQTCSNRPERSMASAELTVVSAEPTPRETVCKSKDPNKPKLQGGHSSASTGRHGSASTVTAHSLASTWSAASIGSVGLVDEYDPDPEEGPEEANMGVSSATASRGSFGECPHQDAHTASGMPVEAGSAIESNGFTEPR